MNDTALWTVAADVQTSATNRSITTAYLVVRTEVRSTSWPKPFAILEKRCVAWWPDGPFARVRLVPGDQ
jgi:hypothetical protein